LAAGLALEPIRLLDGLAKPKAQRSPGFCFW
jgi:hypothetical protein